MQAGKKSNVIFSDSFPRLFLIRVRLRVLTDRIKASG